MSARLKALYELQSVDLELAKLQKVRAALNNGSAKKLEVETARQEAEKAEKLLHEAATELRDKELNLKTVEAKQKTYHDKLYAGTVSNAKELSSMEKEIEMLGRQKGKLEERILELMEIIEELKAKDISAKDDLKQCEEELAAILEKSKKENSILVSRIRKLLPEREAAATLVDPILLKRYETSRERMGGILVSKMVDDDCSACHTQIGLGLKRLVQKDDELQTCDNCGRILYLEK